MASAKSTQRKAATYSTEPRSSGQSSVRLAGIIGLAALLVALAAPAAFARTKTVVISASKSSFTDTGVRLPAGGSAVLSAKGDGTCHAGGASDCPIGNPAGTGALCSASGPNHDVNSPPGPAGPDVPYDAVAGKIGKSGKPFLIGRGKTVHRPGELFVVFNDCQVPVGYSDNAGSYTVTIKYKTKDILLSGRVTHYVCRDTEYMKGGGQLASICYLTSVKPLSNVEVLAAGKHFRSARTRADGSYEIAVPRGRAYTVSIFGSIGGHLPSRHFGSGATVKPESYRVSGTSNAKDLNFQLCKPPSEPFGNHEATYSGPKLRCGVKLYEYSGTLRDIYGQPVSDQYVAIDPGTYPIPEPDEQFETGGLDDAIKTDSHGHFQLFIKRGTHQVWAGTVERLQTVTITRDLSGVRLEIKPIIFTATGNPDGALVTAYGLPTSPRDGFLVTIQHAPVLETVCQYHVPPAETYFSRIVPASFVPFGFEPSFHKFCFGHWTAFLTSARDPQKIVASEPFTIK